jgi:hypothetical protein
MYNFVKQILHLIKRRFFIGLLSGPVPAIFPLNRDDF